MHAYTIHTTHTHIHNTHTCHIHYTQIYPNTTFLCSFKTHRDTTQHINSHNTIPISHTCIHFIYSYTSYTYNIYITHITYSHISHNSTYNMHRHAMHTVHTSLNTHQQQSYTTYIHISFTHTYHTHMHTCKYLLICIYTETSHTTYTNISHIYTQTRIPHTLTYTHIYGISHLFQQERRKQIHFWVLVIYPVSCWPVLRSDGKTANLFH